MYQLRDPSHKNLLRWLRDRSRVVQAIYEAACAISAWSQTRANQSGSSKLAEAGMDYAAYREPRDPVWTEAWSTEALIVLMRDEVKERQAKFFVVTLSGPLQVHPDPKVRQASLKEGGLNDLFYPDLRVKGLCEGKAFRH